MFAGVVCGKQVLSLDRQESIPRIYTWEMVVWQDDLFGMQKSKEFPPEFQMSHLPLSRHGNSPTLS